MIYSNKEFAAHCGISAKVLSVYKGRGKVVVTSAGIDDLNLVNDFFIKKHRAKITNEVFVPDKIGTKPRKEKPLIPKQENPLVELTRQKGTLDLQQKRNLVQLQQMEIDKKRGELIPTALIRNLFVQHSESLKAAYGDMSDNLIEVMAQKKGFSREEISDLRSQNRRMINKSVDTAIDSSRGKLRAIVDEYSKKRGVGEHD